MGRVAPLLPVVLAACAPSASAPLAVTLTLEPDPPRVGASTLVLEVEDESGPLHDADVSIEANMNHAGMVPVFAEGRETDDGRYAAGLEFTMPGDWFLLVTATTAEGKVKTAQLDVRVVGVAR